MNINTSGYDPLAVPITVHHDTYEDEFPSEYIAELEAINAQLLEAAKDVVARWDSPQWKWDEHTGVLIDRLRSAIAKAEGEVMP